MSGVCKTALDSATVEESRDVFSFKLECKNAIGAVIGFPTRAHIRKAEAALASKPSSKRKHDLRMALAKYDEHKTLFDKLYNYIVESSEEVNFDRGLVNPRTSAENWRLIFAKRLQGEITPISIQQSSRKIHSLNGLVDRIIKKRNQNLKRGKLSKLEIMLAPPDIIMSHVDFSGRALQLVNKALRIGDKDISMVNKFNREFDNIRTSFARKWEHIVTSSINTVFNLNNSSMAGVRGFFDTEENEVLIVGEGIYNGVNSYKILNEETNEIEWLAKDELQATDEEVREGLVKLYTDDLTNELLDGQVRKIIPKVLNWDIDEDGYLVSEETGQALQVIKEKLKLMQKEGKREEGDRVSGIHEKRITVPVGKKGKTKDIVYRYIMIKQGEQSVGEEYHAYLIDKHEVDTRGKKINEVRFIGQNKQYNFLGEALPSSKTTYDQAEVDQAFDGGGFYKSNKINDFGRLMNRKDKPIEGTHTKQYIDFEKMENQPNEEIMNDVFTSVHQIRQVLSRVWLDATNKASKLQDRREQVQNKIVKYLKKQNPKITEEEIEAYFNELYSIGGINSRIWYNADTGTLRTADSWAKKKSQNYIPHLYERGNIILTQIPRQLSDLKTKLERAERAKDNDKINQYELGIQHLEELMMRLNNEDNDNSQKIIDLQSTQSLKHITSWTDQTQRRKDGDIYKEYLEGIYRSYHRNEVIVELLNTVYSMQRMGETNVDGIIEYLKNRTKIAFGDSKTRAQTPLGNYGYEQISNKLNNIAKIRGNDEKHTPESAERIIKWMTTPATMRFLGSQAAMGNHTQIVNQIISTGMGTFLEAHRIMGTKDSQKEQDWREIVDNTGVLNLVTMFQDVMLQGADIKWNDFGFVPFTESLPFGIPSHNMAEFGRVLAKGRDSFVNSKDKNIDEFVLKLVIKSKSRKEQEQLKYLKNLNALRKRINQTDLDKKKGQLYDILSMDDNQTEKIIKDQFKALVGDVADTKLRKMVSWKLSYSFNSKSIGEWFTFTGGEELLRKTTIIMALLDAKKRGILGGRDNTPDKELFMSNQAVRIARDAVYNTQFGMTPQYLGEGFNGFGRLLFQYKQYPTMQMIHDYNVVKKFTDGNRLGTDGVIRITKAVTDAMVRGATQKGRRKGYDPKDPYLDQEALAMARFLFTRGVASAVSSMISTVAYISPLIRWAGGSVGVNLVRSAENPLLGLTMRWFVWVSLMAMGWSDEEEDAKDNFLNKIRFTLMPVLLGAVARDIATTLDWIED